MENKKSNVKSLAADTVYALQIAGVVALTLIIALPVYMYMRKASNIGASLSRDRLSSFESSTAEIKDFGQPSGPLVGAGGLYEGQRATTAWTMAGSAVLTVNAQNITKLTPADFTKVGATPFSLLNTVGSNQNIPSIVSVVFDNRNVVEAFLSRATTQALLNNPQPLTEMIQNNDYAIDKFFNNPIVAETLDNEPMMLALAGSALFGQVLQSKTAQYFIKNPQAARQLVNGNKTLSALLGSESLKKFLMAGPATKTAAQIFYGAGAAEQAAPAAPAGGRKK
jgi:hypothetical protein